MILIASIFNGSLLDVVGIGADSYEYFANGLEYYKLFLNETDFNDPFEILDAAAQVSFNPWQNRKRSSTGAPERLRKFSFERC